MIYKMVAFLVVLFSVVTLLKSLYGLDRYLSTTKDHVISKAVTCIAITMWVTLIMSAGKFIVDYLEGLAHGIH